jgi:uncharacterized protein (TIRG00374 family)
LSEQAQTDRVMTSFISFVLKIILGIGIVFFLFIKLDLSRIVHTLLRANFGYLCLGLIGTLISRILLAWQTATAIRHYEVVLSIKRVFIINLIVNFYSLFLPSVITGTIIKWYRLSQQSGKQAEIFAAVICIKIYYLTFMLTAGVAALIFENPFGQNMLNCAVLAWLLAIAFVLFIFCGQSLPVISNFGGFIFRWLPHWLGRRSQKLWVELNDFKKLAPFQLFYFLVTPLLVLACVVAVNYLTAIGLGLNIPLFSIVWISAMVILIQHVPAFISGLGLREGALVMLLPMYGVKTSQAMAFSLVLFGYVLAMGLLGGFFELNEQFLQRKACRKSAMAPWPW